MRVSNLYSIILIAFQIISLASSDQIYFNEYFCSKEKRKETPSSEFVCWGYKSSIRSLDFVIFATTRLRSLSPDWEFATWRLEIVRQIWWIQSSGDFIQITGYSPVNHWYLKCNFSPCHLYEFNSLLSRVLQIFQRQVQREVLYQLRDLHQKYNSCVSYFVRRNKSSHVSEGLQEF